MSNLMNKGVNIRCKAITASFFTVVWILVEPSTFIEKNSYFEEYPSSRQLSITVTSSSTAIPSSLLSSLFFGNILRTNNRIHLSRDWQWSSFGSEVWNIAALFGMRKNWKNEVCLNQKLSIHHLPNQVEVFVFRSPSISKKMTI